RSDVVRGRRDPQPGAGAGGATRRRGLRGGGDGAGGAGRERGRTPGRSASAGAGGRRVTPAEQARVGLAGLAALASRVAELHAADIARLAALYVDTLRGGGTLWFAGNGGSAADAQHVAAEYVVRYGRTRRALPAVALTTDTSLLTACGNDLGFEMVFARQVERSEEHTSELQSRFDLVCRLLLE